MSFFASKKYQRVANFAFAAILVISTFTASVPFLFSKTANAITTTSVCSGGCNAATLQSAIDTATPGDVISLAGNVIAENQVTIDKPLTLNGNGHTISPTFALPNPKTGKNNATLGIEGTTGVLVTNLIVDGTGGTNLHGIDAFKATATLDDVIVNNNTRNGLVVNGSDITVNNIHTANNAWGGIDVDISSTTNPSSLTVNGVSTHSEAGSAIYVDDTTKDVHVYDTNNQYVSQANVKETNDLAYVLKPAPTAAPTNLGLTYIDANEVTQPLSCGAIVNSNKAKIWHTNGSLSLNWTAPTGTVTGYVVNVAGPNGNETNYGGTNAYSWLQFTQGDGTYTYNVRANSVGGLSGPSASCSVVYDHTAPVVTVTPVAGTLLHGTETFNITVADANLNTAASHVYVYLYNNGGTQKSRGKTVDLSSGHATVTLDTTKLDDGLATLDVGRFADAAGNFTGAADTYFRNYSIDNTIPNAPNGLFFSANGTTLTNLTVNSTIGNNIVLGWADPTNSPSGIIQHITEVDGPNGYTHQFWNQSLSTWLNKNGGEFGQHGDGAYTYKVKSENAAGTWSDWSTPLTLNYDSKSPVVSNIHMSPQVNGNIGRTTTITFDLNDATGIDFTKTKVLFADGPNSGQAALESAKYTPVLVSGSTYKVVIDTASFLTLNYTGRYTLAFNLYDTVGNHTSTKPVDSSNILIDNSGPSATFTTPINGSPLSGTQHFSFNIVDDTQVASAYMKFNGPTTKQVTLVHGTGNEWYADVDTAANLTDGSYTLDVRATDIFGTPRYNANRGQVTIDNKKPVATITSPVGGQSINSSTITIVGTATDENFNDYYCWVSNAASNEVGVRSNTCTTGWSPVTNGVLGTVDLSGLPDGQYVANVGVVDKAGNQTIFSTAPFTRDTTPPTVEITSPTNGVTFGNGAQVTIEGSTGDASSYTLSIGKTGETPLATDSGTSFSSYIWDTSAVASGNYIATLIGADAAGNPSESEVVITVDNTAPVLTVAPQTDTTGNQPTITGTVNDPAATLTVVFNGGAPVAVANNAGTFSFTVPAPLANGTYAFSIQAKDVNGNISTQTANVVVAATPLARQASTVTPLITPASSEAVLGATTEKAASDAGVKGATDTKTADAVSADANSGTIFGLAWYWWILILAALAAIAWFIIAAIRRRNEEQA